MQVNKLKWLILPPAISALLACVTDRTKHLISLSAKQHQNPCSDPPPVYQDLRTQHGWPVTVKLGKPWTPEILLECYYLAREKPMRCEKNKPQARTLISLWFCAQFTCLDLCCDSHNTINILKIFQVFTVSWSHCNKGIVNLPVRLKGNLKCIYGNRWLYGIMDLEQVYGCCFADKSLLTGVRLCLWCSVPTAISV